MNQSSRIWLRTVRASLDQTQAQAASAVGVSRHTFARWESGTLSPDLEQAVELALWAGKPLDDVAAAFGFDLGGETVAEEADRLTDCTP
jgi:DNA-binding XRE family transcriptional regulator